MVRARIKWGGAWAIGLPSRPPNKPFIFYFWHVIDFNCTRL